MTSATLGVASGLAFAWLWLWVVPWAVHGRFFRKTGFLMKELLKADDPAKFLRQYGSLLADTARYVGRNLLGTVLAGLPAVALLILVEVDEAPFLVAFVAAMMVVFCSPRLWPAPRAS